MNTNETAPIHLQYLADSWNAPGCKFSVGQVKDLIQLWNSELKGDWRLLLTVEGVKVYHLDEIRAGVQMIYTKFIHTSNNALVALVETAEDRTDLELELAERLRVLMEEFDSEGTYGNYTRG